MTTFDCVLMDLGLPDATGLEALRSVLEGAADTAVLVLTGLADEHSGTDAVAAGAQDYLVKGQVDGELLVRSIRYAVERKRADEQLRRLYASELREAENARLERGLLPHPATNDSRLRITTRYRSGRDGVLGGDFFDVVETADQRLFILVGDVSGHGPDEAALGVALRIAWRTLVLAGGDLDDLLPTLDRVLIGERRFDEVFATLCTARGRAVAGTRPAVPRRPPRAAGAGRQRRRRPDPAARRPGRPGARDAAGRHLGKPADRAGQRLAGDAVQRRPGRGPDRAGVGAARRRTAAGAGRRVPGATTTVRELVDHLIARARALHGGAAQRRCRGPRRGVPRIVTTTDDDGRARASSAWSLRRRLRRVLAALSVLVIALIALSVVLLVGVRRDQQQVIDRYFTAINISDQRFISQLDAETAVRGYALSGLIRDAAAVDPLHDRRSTASS